MSEIVEAVEEEFGVALRSRHQAGPLMRLLDDGKLTRYCVLEGIHGEYGRSGSYTYRVPDLDSLSLRTIWEMAKQHVVPREELDLKAGRRSTAGGHESRRILAVHEGQLRAIRAALTKVVEHLIPSARRQPRDSNAEAWGRILEGMAQIGAPQLVWAEGGGAHGLGDWAILDEVGAATRSLARATRNKYVGAIRTLLDLGASHGYLIQRDVHGAQRSYLPTAWAEALEAWEEIVRASPHSNRSAGTAQLSRIMAAVAEFFGDRLDEIDPMALTEEQSTAFGAWFASRLRASQTITSHHRSATLAALRALMDAGVMSQVPMTEFDRRRIQGRKSAFSASAMRDVAGEFCVDGRKLDADYELFQALGTGAFFDAENPYSLPRLVDWYTLRATRHRRRKGMTAINDFPREPVRGSGGLSGRAWVEATVKFHLELLGTYLGWLQRHEGIDLDGDVDARHLFSIDLLDRFVDAVEGDGWTTPNRALEIIKHASLYCSPCWEAAAVANGEIEAADGFQALADYANGRGMRNANGRHDGLTTHQSQAEEWGLAQGDEARIKNMKRRARNVQRAYETVSGDHYAYIAMLRVRNAAIDRICRELGVGSLEELQQQIETDRKLELSEFCILRNIGIYGDSLAAPHRRGTISQLDRSDYRETTAGVLWQEISGQKFKVTRNGDFQLKLGDRSRDPGPGGYRFDLRDCYLAAREQIKGAHSEVMYLSTSPDEREREPFRLAPDSISGLYRAVLTYAAEELGWDISPILADDGLATGHSHRHAVGSYFVATERPELARRMLHHKGSDTLLKVYGAGKIDMSAEEAMVGVEL